MNNSIFKSILIGLLVGLLAFVAFRFVLVLLIVGAIFKLSGKGKWKKEQWRNRKLVFADNIRTMNEEDYEEFKSNFGKHSCHSFNNQMNNNNEE